MWWSDSSEQTTTWHDESNFSLLLVEAHLEILQLFLQLGHLERLQGGGVFVAEGGGREGRISRVEDALPPQQRLHERARVE